MTATLAQAVNGENSQPRNAKDIFNVTGWTAEDRSRVYGHLDAMLGTEEGSAAYKAWSEKYEFSGKLSIDLSCTGCEENGAIANVVRTTNMIMKEIDSNYVRQSSARMHMRKLGW